MAKPEDFLVSRQFPYCKGCSHRLTNLAMAQAFARLDLDPLEVVLVSDIGCVGLLDRYFTTHTVHTLHGRSTAIAAGLRLTTPSRPPYYVVVIGDGGATIGLLHLVEAARWNLDITVFLHNNFLYGMTGGQHSGLTPVHLRTRTTPQGNLFAPIPLLDLLDRSGATFVARTLAQDPQLPEIMAQAIQHPGFAIVEILELCTGYAVPMNRLTGKKLQEMAQQEGWQLGILKAEERPSLTRTPKGDTLPPLKPLRVRYTAEIPGPFSLFLAGSAGEGVQSAARWFATALNLGGLYTTQKNDNPVTVGTGYSTAELKVSPTPIGFTGIEQPDVVIVTSRDGLQRIQGVKRLWRGVPRFYLVEEQLQDHWTIHDAPVDFLPLRQRGTRTAHNIAGLLEAWVRIGGRIPRQAWIEAGERTPFASVVQQVVQQILGSAAPG